MAVVLCPFFMQFLDDNGNPLAGGKVYTYAAGTSTPKATFTDFTEAVAAANPVVLDSAGRTTMWISGAYKFVLTDSLGNVIRTTDNVTAFSVPAASANAYFQEFSGNGVLTAFTLSTDLGTDEKAVLVFVNNGGWIPNNPNQFTLTSGGSPAITFTVAPPNAASNIRVYAPSLYLGAASASAAAAATSEANAAASALLASQWATLTSGIVAATDYSSKAWAIGGTGVTGIAAKGASKEWAITTGAAVDTSEFSSKEYAVGTFATAGSSKSWATITGAAVAGGEFSAKEYSAGTFVTAGSAKSWATITGGVVGGTAEYSAKEYAVGTTVATGSSKDWAQKTSATVDGSGVSAKAWALGGTGISDGAAKNWAQQTGGDVTGAAALSRSAKSWAQDNLAGATYGGSAKDWAQSASKPDGTNESSKTYATQAAASAATAAGYAAALTSTSTTSLLIATGAKVFTTQASKAYVPGQFISAVSAANNANFMHGTVTTYTGTTLTINVTDIGGSGTLADWQISISGSQGSAGATGAAGTIAATVATGTANALVLTPTTPLGAYAYGDTRWVTPAATNTSGTVTIAVSGLAARNIKKFIGGAVVILAVGDMIINQPMLLVDDGTQYILSNPQTYTQGADVASSGTTNLDTATGDYVNITGTTSITAVTLSQGRQCTVKFAGILTFTNGASLILPTGANITTAAGDTAVLRGEASGVVRCVSYMRASGASLAASGATSLSGLSDALNDAVLNNMNIGSNSAFTTSSFNTFVGRSAGNPAGNTNSNNNVAVGYQAFTTAGNGTTACTAVGYQAAKLTSGAEGITAIGYQALSSVASSNYCTAVGESSGASVTGTGHTLVGYGSGFSGTAITTGSYCTMVGHSAQVNSASAVNRTSIGSLAACTADNSVQIGDSGVTVVTCGTSNTASVKALNTAKMYIKTTGATGSRVNAGSFNVTSITDTGIGDFTFNLTTSFANSSYTIGALTELTNTTYTVGNDRRAYVRSAGQAAGSIRLTILDQTVTTNVVKDPTATHCWAFGSQ